MPTFTVTEAAERKEGGFFGEDGAYPVTLVEIGEPVHKQLFPGDKPRACKLHGQKGYDMIEWTFEVEDAPAGENLLWARTSTALNERSKMYGFVTALFGGKSPPVGFELDTRTLYGRWAVATIKRSEQGFINIEDLGPMSKAELSRRVGAATGAPIAAPPAPVATVATADPDDLPF